ncbi:nuclear pore glyco p62 [Pelobates cultripes]|uniref:Nuclear pore glyco p62 n=1 Tax=Pelobates cultripes TaxID=61616 RepID=A0AAD1WNP0_PELCU|nr:nuclear pore glyco p62 [Pelobates cultripes]
MSGFNFGSAAATGGFSFGTPKTNASTTNSGFSFGAGGTAPSGGFSFGNTTQNPVSLAGQQSVPFSFSTPASTGGTTSGFSFGAHASSAPAPAAGILAFGNSAPKLNIGSGPQAAVVAATVSSTVQPSQTTGGFSFGLNPTNTVPATSTAAGGFSLSGTASNNPSNAFGQTTAQTGLSFGTPVSTAVVSAATSTQAATNFSQGLPAAATSSGFGLPSGVASSNIPASATLTHSLAIGSTLGTNLNSGEKPSENTSALRTAYKEGILQRLLMAVGVSIPTGVLRPMNQKSILQRSSALAQKRTSIRQAHIVSSFLLDLGLLKNDLIKGFGTFSTSAVTASPSWVAMTSTGNKIHELVAIMATDSVDLVAVTETWKDREEFEYGLANFKGLDGGISQMTNDLGENTGKIFVKNCSEKRAAQYKLAENIDAQLKRMAQDLKDVIEHLNTSTGPGDTNNPLQQICKILNAHMDSLQWIDQNSALLQRKVEQVTIECENRRKEQDRGFPITFD